MARKKSMVVVAALCVILVMLGGCQTSPAKEVIANKNNNLFDSNAITSENEIVPSSEENQFSFYRDFSSTDESVLFHIGIDQTLPTTTTKMPVVQVSPHYLTEEDAKRIATAFFPNAFFYEAEPPQTEKLSKSEIQEKIYRWTQYSNIESLKSLYGDRYSDAALDDFLDTTKQFIEKYTLLYETAPEESTHVACGWKMRKAFEYMFSPEELANMDINDSNDEISAQLMYDNIPYYFTATTRNRDDFKVNMVSIYVYAGMGPVNLDENIFHSKLTRTAEPTQQEIDRVKTTAERILSEINLGEWKIDECYVDRQTCGEATEYTIFVNAVPILGDLPTLRRSQLTSLKNMDGYAAEQYYTDANFAFSADGKLISFNLFTPIEIQKVANDNADVISMTSLLEQAQEYLSLTDSYAYGFGDFLPLIGETVQCDVTISELEYGLSRIKVQNEKDIYSYVPSIVLKGDIEYMGKESGKIFYSTESEELVYINAIDGTIINQTNS